MTFNTFFLIRLLLLRYIIIEPLVSMYIYSAVYVPLHLYTCFQLPEVVNLALVHARYDRVYVLACKCGAREDLVLFCSRAQGFILNLQQLQGQKEKFLYMRMLSRGKMTAIGGGWMEGYYVWAEAKKEIIEILM